MSLLATPYEIQETTDGIIPQGALFISVKNTGTQTATVNGVPLAPGKAKSYSFVGKPLIEIAYAATGTTLDIMYIL